MIVVTGAAGFIGSCMVSKLNNKGIRDIILVDDFTKSEKLPNIAHKSYTEKIERAVFFPWLEKHTKDVEFIFHIGARTDTTEFNPAVFEELNVNYSKDIWKACCDAGIPLVYASSAATYGDGSLGYSDLDPSLSFRLKPLNPYGVSKNEFDQWVLQQTQTPPRWYGLKFFNVFGPNEYHKGRMASVVFHAFNQADRRTSGQADGRTSGQADRRTGGQADKRTGGQADKRTGGQADKRTGGQADKRIGECGNGAVRLFRSHNPDFRDGEQLRDFIYVKDVTDVLYFLMNHPSGSGIYNLGTGKARTFLDLVNAVFTALNLPPSIEFIDTPADIRDKYQYFTEAKMEKLHSIGYSRPFYTLEQAVEEYVQGYLLEHSHF
jgi:ADP-L-glycero-D-manno-heptose 6-epimerase